MGEDSSGQQVARILYKEIVGGDVRKKDAKSNDSDSGGGARDYRFPYEGVRPIVERMFPTSSTLKSGKLVHHGVLSWFDPGATEPTRQAIKFMTPTKSRGREGWISQVPSFPCFTNIPSGSADNRIVLMLIQNLDDSVWPFYAQEKSLRTPDEWDERIATHVLRCLDAKRRKGNVAVGYIDLVFGESYFNGK